MSGPNNRNDLEDNQNMMNQNFFNDNQTGTEKLQQQLRLGFIRKVLGILTTQLLITFGFCLLVTNDKQFFNFMKSGSG